MSTKFGFLLSIKAWMVSTVLDARLCLHAWRNLRVHQSRAGLRRSKWPKSAVLVCCLSCQTSWPVHLQLMEQDWRRGCSGGHFDMSIFHDVAFASGTVIRWSQAYVNGNWHAMQWRPRARHSSRVFLKTEEAGLGSRSPKKAAEVKHKDMEL